MKRVAIVQNSIIFGGRLDATLRVVELLNDLGITPDIITARMPRRNEIHQKYKQSPQFNLIRLFSPPLPSDLEAFLLHLRAAPLVKRYDLVIGHSNTSLFLPSSVPLLLYVFFPRKARADSPLASIHLPEERQGALHPAKWYKRFLRQLYKRERLGNNVSVAAISHYVRDVTAKAFGIEQSQIQVVYPPVDLGEYRADVQKTERVVTVGRFTPYKRQLEQLEIAAELPSLDFTIVGFVSSAAYFRQCEQYRELNKLRHVTFRPNVSFGELQDLLEASTFFMHNVVNEPLGLTTIQALAAGCIPIVHDSGGQREVVPERGLRFSSPREAIAILESLHSNSKLNELRGKLHNYIERNFSQDIFRERMSTALARFL